MIDEEPEAGPAANPRAGLNAPALAVTQVLLQRLMLVRVLLVLIIVTCSGAAVAAQSIPPAVISDPSPDPTHPARMAEVRIPTHGVSINGIVYVAAGAGPHPVVIFFKGLPGNEQSLDLAQAIRRAGWNVLTMHFRGSWGSPGAYSYHHQLEDAEAAIDFVRDPVNVHSYGSDAEQIVLAGHSTGGAIAVITAAKRADIAGLVLISATDDSAEAVSARADPKRWRDLIKGYDESLAPLVGCTGIGLAEEALENASSWSFAVVAPRLVRIPLLIISSDDGFRSEGEALATAINAHGGTWVTKIHLSTDHAYSDHRIALQGAVVTWLQGHPWRTPGAVRRISSRGGGCQKNNAARRAP